MLRGWGSDPQRRYRGPIGIGEYYNLRRLACLPLCPMRVMQRDLPYYYHEANARQFHYMHVSTRAMGTQALTNYQMARQLWDIDTDCESLWVDYFRRRYGPAADPMRRFYETLETAMAHMPILKAGAVYHLGKGRAALDGLGIAWNANAEDHHVGPTMVEAIDACRRARQAIDRAGRLDLEPRIAARIAEDSRRFTYGERTLGYYVACMEAFEALADGDRPEARRHEKVASRLAEQLRNDTTTTRYSAHANAPNALEASRAPEAARNIRRRLAK
jgi:hypothetical protein